MFAAARRSPFTLLLLLCLLGLPAESGVGYGVYKLVIYIVELVHVLVNPRESGGPGVPQLPPPESVPYLPWWYTALAYLVVIIMLLLAIAAVGFGAIWLLKYTGLAKAYDHLSRRARRFIGTSFVILLSLILRRAF